jgi:hypothetical protein
MFPLGPISSEDRTTDNNFQRNRGNYKSSIKNCEFLEKMMTDDISRGFALPLLAEILHLLPNAS